MLEQDSPALGLLLQNVDSADSARIAAFLRLGAGRLRHPWRIVNGGRARVLLSGSDFIDTLPGEVDGPITALRLVDVPREPGADATGVLARPLQYDDFIDALAGAEPGPVAAVAAPPRRADSAPAPASLAGSTAVSGASPPPPRGGPASLFSPPADARYRLRRWPEAALLADRYHVRLASFLSTRPLGLDDLARYSNVNHADCVRFIQALGEAGLLDVHAEATPPTSADPATPPPAAARVAEHSAASGDSLFSRLRRRLGLP